MLRSAGVTVICGGSDARGLAAKLAEAAHSASAIISFGMSGALSPVLRIGDWVIGNRLCGKIEAECDPAWLTALQCLMPSARVGPCYADGSLISDPAEKHALAVSHGLLIADMESHIAAETAARAGLPFAILRCVSDEAAHALPPAIAVAMRPDGRIALGAILKSVIGNPRQLIDIRQTLGHFNQGYAAMRRDSSAIIGRLGFDLR